MRSRILALFCMLPIVIAVGCGGATEDQWTKDRPKVVPVSGTVTYNGDPVEGADVVFRSSAKGGPAYAKTDAEGRFELTTYEPGDGAVPGSHQVRISKIVVHQPEIKDPEGVIPPTTEENQLPAKYNDFDQSKLTASVAEDGENDFKFELTD
ncbi:carboxypeptidase-like regulatory domain-containing protein [Thalassoroseus pseudoceratinae]|uniref:carboxypeptidase-like regulatory domain-containing protein n=1 Tax=Thalassoroseus pseudoceratinae TaxID=2713176 RepID=UPI0014209876|nr:carboxypeptidase-like regulatory domain-containing protein [Thalassoroseus pseudoceratinae]